MPVPIFDSVIKQTFDEGDELVEDLRRNREINSSGKLSFVNVYQSSNIFQQTTTIDMTQNIFNSTSVTQYVYNFWDQSTLAVGAEAQDHGTASVDQIVNVCYGTGAPPTANTTTEGTIFFQYTTV